MRLQPTNIEFWTNSLSDGAIRPWVQLSSRSNFVQLLQLYLSFSVQISFWLFFSSITIFILVETLDVIYVLWNELIYGVPHWRALKSRYRKLAWVVFEPMTNKFCSDVLIDRAVRLWVQLALTANFVQFLQFNLLFSVLISFWLLPLSVASFF